MQISGIYKIQSKVKSNRCYIGSSIFINKRWRKHINDLKTCIHGSIKLQRHFNKYGIADLQFSILLGCEKEDLIKTEQYFIDSYNPYFNTCKTAGSQLGIKRSEETKRKISEAVIKTWSNPEYKKAHTGENHPSYGIPQSDESKKKNSELNKGRICWKKGLTKETDKRVKSYPCSEKHKRQLSEFHTGKKHSKETIQKISEAQKRRHEKNRLRKQSESMKLYWKFKKAS